MGTMTIRYDDELESTIEDLKNHYHATTKNKVIVTVLENHKRLINQLSELRENNRQLDRKYDELLDLIKTKHDADNALANHINKF